MLPNIPNHSHEPADGKKKPNEKNSRGPRDLQSLFSPENHSEAARLRKKPEEKRIDLARTLSIEKRSLALSRSRIKGKAGVG